RAMLGLADRGRIRRLLESILTGDAPAMLEQLDEAHALGIDPTSLIRGLMESLHGVTRAKAGAVSDALQSEEEREAAAGWASKLNWAGIHRLWQMLLKGLNDVAEAPDPPEAAAMALLRLIHAADLPDPAALVAKLSASESPAAAPATAPSAPAGPSAPSSYRELVDRLQATGKRILAQELHDQVGLVSFAPPELVLKPLRPLGAEWSRDLAAALKDVTGSRWTVSFTDQGGEPSLQQQEQIAEETVRAAVLDEPNVRAVMETFPDATLESFHSKGA
ncbi:MAG TPA: DNA polymerase III subunit gamma/tau, partial [Sphingomicrobium sp.]|nr:DNA polymerase III subunit gamma/tau [Sphingomicrobium sp.]